MPEASRRVQRAQLARHRNQTCWYVSAKSPPLAAGRTRHVEHDVKRPLMERTGWSLKVDAFCERPPRLRQLRRLREILFMAQAPLLSRRGFSACLHIMRNVLDKFLICQNARSAGHHRG